ncbi:lipocalin family protein [Aquimarina sp. ERC-38]|uniref:lipocalin family protein n=1 Tax=Aquimarina sp. ERC-38 TaxID=2949996 RepID=UPI002246B413|nr:lipocalin family protein [Aquimarina sp. ERC-38]UZO80118.1 lipocalin family protein [Aquimarina sp. ERC-38]
MKTCKYIVVLISFILLGSCSATTRTINGVQRSLKGQWSLDKITYSRSGIFDVILYDDASAECLTGSVWTFIPNNNTGFYSVNQSSCVSTGDRRFRFNIPESDANGNFSFLFKPIDAKKKSTNGNRGYRMGLPLLDENQMTWTQTISMEGAPFVITMNFNRLQQ